MSQKATSQMFAEQLTGSPTLAQVKKLILNLGATSKQSLKEWAARHAGSEFGLPPNTPDNPNLVKLIEGLAPADKAALVDWINTTLE